MILAILLFLSTAFPSASRTSWMTPQSFHLTIGMSRADATRTLEEFGWETKKGRNGDEIVFDYAEDKALTLLFRNDRLASVRFELFALLPDIRAAFNEQSSLLANHFGIPKKRSGSIIVYDDRLPNVMVVLSADPKSEYGRKGFGYLAVRYYDPLK